MPRGPGGRTRDARLPRPQAYYAEHEPETYAFRQRLYAREAAVAYRRGTLLLYRYDLWHRGTPLRAGAPVRRVVNLAIAHAAAHWITPWNCEVHLGHRTTVADVNSCEGFAKRMYFGNSEILAAATHDDRTRLGVPSRRDAYWTDEMIEAVAKRFPGWDMGPYVDEQRHWKKCVAVINEDEVRAEVRAEAAELMDHPIGSSRRRA